MSLAVSPGDRFRKGKSGCKWANGGGIAGGIQSESRDNEPETLLRVSSGTYRRPTQVCHIPLLVPTHALGLVDDVCACSGMIASSFASNLFRAGGVTGQPPREWAGGMGRLPLATGWNDDQLDELPTKLVSGICIVAQRVAPPYDRNGICSSRSW
jgi:hypothetical protein